MTISNLENANITETASWNGRQFILTWMPAPFVPPLDLVTNVRGLCYTEQGLLVLAAGADREWTLPGGHREPGESMEQTLIREIREEICASVEAFTYLGAQKVVDEGNGGLAHPHYHIRFWARVRMEDFIPSHEVHYLSFIQPAMLLTTLNWQTKRILDAVLQASLIEERQAATRRSK